MTERRYDEAQVAAIFRRATEEMETAHRRAAPADGLTLSELEGIGREVGLPPEAIRRAARALEGGEQRVVRTFLGLPLGVGRTVELDRRLTDDEWERLVVDLRETFDARGATRRDGGLREWRNGNLQALLEPTATGHRLRLRTIKGDARGMMSGGLMTIGGGVLTAVVAAMRGAAGDMDAIAGAWALMTLGAGMFTAGAVRLPSWARRRRQQMDEVAERLALATSPQDG